MLTPERERLAEALAIKRLHGDRARLWVAERLGSLLLAGDLAGVQRFEEIARRLEAPGRQARPDLLREPVLSRRFLIGAVAALSLLTLALMLADLQVR